jgi:hypothetical protein
MPDIDEVHASCDPLGRSETDPYVNTDLSVGVKARKSQKVAQSEGDGCSCERLPTGASQCGRITTPQKI